MDRLFQNVLEISIFTSVAILIFGTFSRTWGKRYGAKWKYFVWMILAIRLVLPVQITLPQPIINIPISQVKVSSAGTQENASNKVELESFPYSSLENETIKQSNITQSTKSVNNSFLYEPLSERIYASLGFLWIFAVLLYFIYQGRKYQLFLRDLNRNSRCIRDAQVLDIYYEVCGGMELKKRPQIFYCGILPSPLCVGFFQQRIYLNVEECRGEQLRYILRHELLHCKRRDTWYKAMLMLAKGIHLFNPFVHWMVRLAEQDMEYSCDSLVLEHCTLAQRQYYGLTILNSIRQGQKANSFSTAFHGGKEELKQRIDHIFDVSKKKRGTLSLLALVLVVWVGTAIVGCTAKTEGTANNESMADLVSTLYQCKLDYIGNHSGVGMILGNLTLPKGLTYSDEGMELFTTEEPYGARQYLTLEGEEEILQDGWFEKNAMIFLALVNNASYFEYSITNQDGKEQILHFSREDGMKYFGNTDLRTLTSDEETFRKFMQELNALFPQGEDAFALKQIQSGVLLDEISEEMGESFSYAALRENPKYEELLKLGDAALSTMLINFGYGQEDDTKGYIMLAACLELLNVPVSVSDAMLQEMTPSQWYASYVALDSTIVEPFQYDQQRYTLDLEKRGLLSIKKGTQAGLITRHSDVQKAVYEALGQRFSPERGNRELQIYAPLISHISEAEDRLSVYAVIGRTDYSFVRTPKVGYQLIEGGGSYIPARLDFEKIDGNWVLKEWVEAKDGSEYAPSIKDMCKGTLGVANDLISYDTREMQMLLMQNLIFYLNGRTDITVYGVSHMDEQDIAAVSQFIPFVQT